MSLIYIACTDGSRDYVNPDHIIVASFLPPTQSQPLRAYLTTSTTDEPEIHDPISYYGSEAAQLERALWCARQNHNPHQERPEHMPPRREVG